MSAQKHILIAEDDHFLLSLLQLQCQSLGMQTCGVENGEQLVAEALSYQYDIVLTDIQMPVCDGIYAMQLLRQLGYDRPIFAMSADPIDNEGFEHVLQKPVNIELLSALCQQTPQQQRVPLQINAELTSLFYKNLHQLSESFALALEHKDLQSLRKICHKIKGSAASFGHSNLSQLADQLQTRLLTEQESTELNDACQQFLQVVEQSGARNERA